MHTIEKYRNMCAKERKLEKFWSSVLRCFAVPYNAWHGCEPVECANGIFNILCRHTHNPKDKTKPKWQRNERQLKHLSFCSHLMALLLCHNLVSYSFSMRVSHSTVAFGWWSANRIILIIFNRSVLFAWNVIRIAFSDGPFIAFAHSDPLAPLHQIKQKKTKPKRPTKPIRTKRNQNEMKRVRVDSKGFIYISDSFIYSFS